MALAGHLKDCLGYWCNWSQVVHDPSDHEESSPKNAMVLRNPRNHRSFATTQNPVHLESVHPVFNEVLLTRLMIPSFSISHYATTIQTDPASNEVRPSSTQSRRRNKQLYLDKWLGTHEENLGTAFQSHGREGRSRGIPRFRKTRLQVRNDLKLCNVSVILMVRNDDKL